MKDLTQITLLLDRSGSMASVRQATVDGVNEFVEGQKAEPGEAHFTLIQFDSNDPYEVLFDKDLKDAPKLNMESFVPRGATPLHDALGQTITELGTRLKNTKDEERPSKVIVVIMTDGYENASHKYTASQLAGMIKHQHDAYKWQFIFLGANQDAIMTGEKLNIPGSHAMSFLADDQATRSSLRSTTANVAAYRRTGAAASLHYTGAQRKAAVKPDDKK